MLKLPGHARYGYSPIVNRPDYTWPGGKQLAFYIALNIEHFAFGAGLGMDPVRSGQQTTRNFAWRDYGNRVGNWRLFEMLDELKLPATILLNSSVCYNYPQIVEKIKARGDDVRIVVADAAVEQDGCRQLELVQDLEQAPVADPVTVVAPGEIARRLLAAADRVHAEPGAEREMLDVERDVEGEPLASGPSVVRPLDDRRIGIAGMARKCQH